MSGAVIGGNVRYPSLGSITDLFRAQINDTFEGATGTEGEGLIMTDLNPSTLTFLNSAIRDTYSDLRNVGDPELLLDNYILTGLPALSAPNAAVQVSLSYAGYFDGFQWHSEWTLPTTCHKVERLWERWSDPQNVFLPMTPAPFGLPSGMQVQRMGQWEMRQNQIWMPGCLVPIDLRIRCRITYPDFFNASTLNFATTYVPILDCQNAVVDKMCMRYSRRFAPDLYAASKDAASESIGKLKLEIVRQLQNTEYQRAEYGDEATVSFPAQWMQL